MILLLKIGLVPFHTWFLILRTRFRWENLYLFLTSQKVIPLHLLSNYRNFSLTIVGLAGWVLSRARRLTSKRLKKLIIYSSLFIGGILLFLLTFQFDWIKFLLVYRLITFPIFAYGKNLSSKKNSAAEREVINHRGIWVWLIFLNLGGIPPLPGFFLKLNFLASVNLAILELIIFITTSIILLYIYLGLGFRALIKREDLSPKSKSVTRYQTYLYLQVRILVSFLVLWMGVITQKFEFWDSKEFTGFKSSAERQVEALKVYS